MQTFVLCLEVRDSKQEMKEWGVADLTGSRDEARDAGGLERSTSLLFFSSSSPSLQSAPDRRSLIGNEPWSRSLSRDQQIATTYRLWCGDSFPSHLYLSIIPVSLPLFLYPSLWVFMGSLWFIQGSVEVRATESRGVFYCSWCVKRTTYSVSARPALTYQDSVIHLEWPCSLYRTDTTTSPLTLVNGRM